MNTVLDKEDKKEEQGLEVKLRAVPVLCFPVPHSAGGIEYLLLPFQKKETP